MAEDWKLKGDFVLSCNCTVFCPCVISLGQHEPTEGYCQAWAGIRIDAGHHESTDISGINVGLLLDIPGPLARGNWTAGLYVDDKASIYAVKALTRIFSGKAGGSTGLLKILVGSFLGVRTEPITSEIKDGTHIFQIPKIIEGVVKPIKGKEPGENYTTGDYTVDEKHRSAALTEEGIAKVEKLLGCGNLYQPENWTILHHVQQALKAHVLFHRDKD